MAMAMAAAGQPAAQPAVQETEVVRVNIGDLAEYERLRLAPNVVNVWADPEITPFPGIDCNSTSTPTTDANVAIALGATRVWKELQLDGSKATIGIVDGGVDASRLPSGRVTGGWSPMPTRPSEHFFPDGAAPAVGAVARSPQENPGF